MLKQGFSHLSDLDSETAGQAMIEISLPSSFSPLTASITEICFICLTESKLLRYKRSSEDLWSLCKRLMWVREHRGLGYISNTNAVSHCLKMIAQFYLLDFLEKNLLLLLLGLQFNSSTQPYWCCVVPENMF